MKIDPVRIKRFLTQIRKSGSELENMVQENALTPDSLALKAAKYLLIELAEAMCNTLQHILAKEKGIAVTGYIDTVVKAQVNGVLSKPLFEKLKPFFDFRNSLVHRYWIVDDVRLVENIVNGHKDFSRFIGEIEEYLHKKSAGV